MVVVDTPDPDTLASFWSEALGAARAQDRGDFIVLDGAMRLAFQLVDDATPGKNRLHLDLVADDPAVEIERLLALGASLVSSVDMADTRWVVLRDPDGNEFCLTG